MSDPTTLRAVERLFPCLCGEAQDIADGLLALVAKPDRDFLLYVIQRKCAVLADRDEVASRFSLCFDSKVSANENKRKLKLVGTVTTLRYLTESSRSFFQAAGTEAVRRATDILECPEQHLVLDAWDSHLVKASEEATELLRLAAEGLDRAVLIDPAFDRSGNSSGRRALLSSLFQAGIRNVEVTGASQHGGDRNHRSKNLERVLDDVAYAWKASWSDTLPCASQRTEAWFSYHAAQNSPPQLHDRYLGLYGSPKAGGKLPTVALCIGTGVSAFNAHYDEYRPTNISRISPENFSAAHSHAKEVRKAASECKRTGLLQRRFTTPLEIRLGPEGSLRSSNIEDVKRFHIERC